MSVKLPTNHLSIQKALTFQKPPAHSPQSLWTHRSALRTRGMGFFLFDLQNIVVFGL